MASSIRLRVDLSIKTVGQGSFDLAWDKNKEHNFECETSPMTVEHLATEIENFVEDLYEQQTRGATSIQVQVRKVLPSTRPDQVLPWDDSVHQHLKPGETVIVVATAVSASQMQEMQEQQQKIVEQQRELIRKSLRFGLNDRVLCWCGPRWFSGHIVGTVVPDDGGILPYLVKTDPVPGAPSSTISVPGDSDEICKQEVCFDPSSELHLVKAAAVITAGSSKPRTRFAVGDKVTCRVRNNATDGLEQWISGIVSEIWPKLGGQETWELGDVSGKFPDTVPYKVDLTSGSWVYCHRDDHTLIRRDGLAPQVRVRGISKRLEMRKAEDGSKERIDHATERRKRVLQSDSSSSEGD